MALINIGCTAPAYTGEWLDPTALCVASFEVRWYGLSYLIGFILAVLLGQYRAKKYARFGWKKDDVSDLIFYSALCVIIGGRLGYVFFYAFDKFLENPLYLFKLWEGGMSFHGGAFMIAGMLVWFAHKTDRKFLSVADFGVPLAPLGLFCGRMGNFINGELWGRPTDVPWAISFPSGGNIPRHPSQLYEAFLEGIVLFAIVWWFSSKPKPRGAVAGLFVAGYGIFRFAVEFVRNPDEGVTVFFGWYTRGMMLSTPMIIFGIGLMVWAYKTNKVEEK